MLGLVDDARAEGLDVTFDLYPYEWSSTRLLIMLPTWIQAGGVGPLKERLADRAARERIRAEMQARGRLFAGDRSWDALRLGAFTRPEHLAWEGRTLGDVMRETGRDAVDAICDLLLAEDLGVNQVTPGPHTDGIRAFLRHPQAMVGTDGVLIGGQAVSAHVRLVPADPRPVRARGAAARARGGGPPHDRRCRRRASGCGTAACSPTARRRTSSLFDPATVRTPATYDEPRQFPIGIPYVIVNGAVVVDDGVHTGAPPGRPFAAGRTRDPARPNRAAAAARPVSRDGA